MLLLPLLGALGQAIGAAIEPCCLSKNVGGVDYVLWDENTGMTSGYGCLQDCVYVRFVLDIITHHVIDSVMLGLMIQQTSTVLLLEHSP